MNLELMIKKDLDLGLSQREIAKKYDVGRCFVSRVKKQGQYYKDITTDEIIFTADKIKLEEQKFHYLCYIDSINNIFEKQTNKLIRESSITTRLSKYLNIHIRTAQRYIAKNKYKLFGCDENGMADLDLQICRHDFEQNEEYYFRKNCKYYVDEFGMVKGYKLWYVYVSPCWLYYIKNYAYEYVRWNRNNKDVNVKVFYDAMESSRGNNEHWYINTRIGIELGRWIISQLNKFSYDYIRTAIYLTIKFDDAKTDDEWALQDSLEISVPKFFYLEKEAYYNNMLSEEYQNMVKKYIY